MSFPFVKNWVRYQLTCTLANTEYSQAITAYPALVRVSCEDMSATFRISFNVGASGTGRLVFQGGEFKTPGFMVGAKTIYVQSPNAGAVIYIEEYGNA